ncbi:MAG TPA: CcdB family protein [Gammaproteobacteria bacterium]|jgi:toxin CcdB|nr:CcdB family protein [Gammaproteobacteria bacterium]
MAQFIVYKNNNSRTRKTRPFLLDIQSDLLSDLQTRLVVPLVKSGRDGEMPGKVTPAIDIGGEPYILVMPQLAGIDVSQIGSVVADLGHYRDEIVAALDFLVTGI